MSASCSRLIITEVNLNSQAGAIVFAERNAFLK